MSTGGQPRCREIPARYECVSSANERGTSNRIPVFRGKDHMNKNGGKGLRHGGQQEDCGCRGRSGTALRFGFRCRSYRGSAFRNPGLTSFVRWDKIPDELSAARRRRAGSRGVRESGESGEAGGGEAGRPFGGKMWLEVAFRVSIQHSVGSGQWAVGSGQWAVGSGQWAVGSGRWGGGYGAGMRMEDGRVGPSVWRDNMALNAKGVAGCQPGVARHALPQVDVGDIKEPPRGACLPAAA